AVLGLIRAHVAADAPCRHCGNRPASADAPLAGLNAAILGLPRHRPGRQRTSGRTTAERRTRHTEEVIVSSDFPTAQGAIMILAIAFLTINLLVDVLYVYLDPRVQT
ncbi:MAG TPA: hypothetical protein VLL30_09990, partial [Reyranella sp.]|nr:hypothetical protein [Reyranella sp.]